MKSLKDKVAAITGAASGIGRASALGMAKLGCHLGLSDVDTKGLSETAEACRKLGVKVTETRVDVANREAIYNWADEIVREHGKVNVILNNAGVSVGATVEDISYSDFEWIMGINFWGVVYGTKAFLPHLKRAGEGSIVNISSVFGLIAVPAQASYNASKFAVKGFTEALRAELEIEGANIGVTCVHPGGIKTNIARSARTTEREGMITAQTTKDFEKAFITTADSAASDIINGILKNSRRVLIGPDAVAIDLMQRLLPTGYQRLVAEGAKIRKRRMLAKV